jgi:hypothetical protein
LKEEDQPVSRRDLGLQKTPRTEIATDETMNRSEFLNLQQQQSQQAYGFNMVDALSEIEQKLNQLLFRLSALENRRIPD